MSKRAPLLCGVAASLALSACGAPAPEPARPEAPAEPAPEAPAEAPPPAEPVAPARAASAAQAINALGAELFGAGQGVNYALSPASVEAAMAMVTAGARGATREELERGLHLAALGEGATAAVGQELRRWQEAQGEGVTLRVANRLFGAAGVRFDADYTAGLLRDFAAPLERLDFAAAPEPARVHINDWVAAQTNDRIEDLLPPGAISSDARLVLVNALYVDARWQVPFDPNATRPAPFTLASGERVQVDTMNREGDMAYAERDGATIVELPYRGGALALRLILPPEGSDPTQLVTAERLSDPRPLVERRVALSLPKFRIEGATVALGEALRALGVRLAFDSNAADFSGMVAAGEGARLALSEVFHQVYARVDEAGTEAAAATAPVMTATSARVDPPQRTVVKLDRPFLFVLRDTRTGAALFVGRVGDPR